jgi:mRNA-degrading endonuclease YafQ of YafQ-DinJ toxin-antitoxin module
MLKSTPFKEYYDKAQWYLKQIDEIFDLIRNKTILSQNEKRLAQAMMKTLKDELKKDCKIANSVRKMNKMTLDERQLYSCVLEANVKLNVRANSHPISSNWSACLLDCRIKIEDCVEYLLSESNMITVFLRTLID